MRFTIKNLREKVENVNKWLQEDNFAVRLTCGACYGHQTLAEYPVYPDGTRRGSYINRVEEGTSRECALAAEKYYGKLFREAQKEGVL